MHQYKYLDLYTITQVTDSYAFIPDLKAGAGLRREKKISMGIVSLTKSDILSLELVLAHT